MPLKRLFHVAINSTDLDRSLAFYRRLGFQALSDRTVNNPNVMKAFQVKSHDLRFVHLRLGDSEDATLLDIVQWFNPDTEPAPPVASQMQRGLTRFAVLTDDTDQVYRDLKAAGETLLTEPTSVMTPQGGWRICLAQDPDGVVVQVTQLLPAESGA
jgi:catechol 2,3-dioxygenase-like lactoylglutathione lyase family enzyme